MSATFWLRIGAIWGFLAVSMGAFGNPGLQGRFESLGSVPGSLSTGRLNEIFHTAPQDHMSCAFALLATGRLALTGRGGAALDAAGWLFLAGSLVFSGSLSILSISGRSGWA